MIPDLILDHVAVAAERVEELIPRYGHDLSGRWVSGGDAPGFRAYQFGYDARTKVEALMPAATEQDDFLRRFLDRSGAGPHHLTYVVNDIRAAIAVVAEMGYRLVKVQLDQRGLEQAFIHPRDGLGVLIQFVRRRGPYEMPAPTGHPAPRTERPAGFVHVAHAVSDLDEALRLFAGLLGGEELARGTQDGSRWTDLVWSGPSTLRLLEPPSRSSPLAGWLDGRPGRVHHLAFEVDRPGQLPDAQPSQDGWYEIEPEANLGTRLMLRPRALPPT
jgi:catechol 2,3-dioxygenase-like lactoylglutathione lyase family enzyme